MGSLSMKVQEEAEKATKDAQAKVNAESERLMEEESAMDVAEVENKVHHAEELAQPLFMSVESESPEGLLEAANVTEEAINSALAELNSVSASMKEKWSSL